MVDVPNEVKVFIGIDQGCIYNFSPMTGVSNHYYVVLNKSPKDDEEIHLAPFSTKKDKILKFIEIKNLDTRTLVEIGKGECKFLARPEETVIDCNRLIHTNKDNLIDLINTSNGSCNYPKLDEGIMARVIEGVKASRMVKEIAQNSM